MVEEYQRQEEDREVEEVPVEEADLQKPTVEPEEVEQQGLETNNQFIFLFTGVIVYLHKNKSANHDKNCPTSIRDLLESFRLGKNQ